MLASDVNIIVSVRIRAKISHLDAKIDNYEAFLARGQGACQGLSPAPQEFYSDCVLKI